MTRVRWLISGGDTRDLTFCFRKASRAAAILGGRPLGVNERTGANRGDSQPGTARALGQKEVERGLNL